jgi:predicted nucleic acid-binding protein
MKIILDSNILFSAIIRNSITREIILDYDGLFLIPEHIIIETYKHKNMLIEKSGLTNQEFDLVLNGLLSKTLVVEKSVLLRNKKEALEVLKNIDTNDTMFFACALAYPDPVIWSDDKALKKQTRVKILNTKEIAAFLKR